MVRRCQHAAWRKIADETVVLDLEKKRMYGLNPTAGFIWQSLDSAADLDALLGTLLAASTSPAFGRAALEAFIAELLELGLVQEVDSAEDSPPVTIEPPEPLEPPSVLWREEVEQIAGTCAFLPAQNPLCTQAPFS